MKTIIYSSLFLLTIQLSFLTNCSITLNHTSCINSSSIKICKGQIIAYYIGKNYPKYINYTLGILNDTFEQENENNINTYGLTNLTKYQIIINAKTEETYLIANIYCTTTNDCALNEIRKLFFKYTHQINPYIELKNLIYIEPSLTKLFCYDISIDQSKQCHNHSICLSYLKELKQECSLESNVYIHEEFILTYPQQIEFNLMNELIRCNRNNCNHIDILTKIQNISRNYVYGNVIQRTNNADKFRISIGILLLTILFE
jgi:hypothetical protein